MINSTLWTIIGPLDLEWNYCTNIMAVSRHLPEVYQSALEGGTFSVGRVIWEWMSLLAVIFSMCRFNLRKACDEQQDLFAFISMLPLPQT